MKVLKFGGTSVGSVEGLSNVISIIKDDYLKGEKPLVVCSALGGVTDCLLILYKAAIRGGSFLKELRALERRHVEMINIFLNGERRDNVLSIIENSFNELETLLLKSGSISVPNNQTLDNIVANGELWSNLIISNIIDQELNGKALLTDARKLVYTYKYLGLAAVNFKTTNSVIKSWYEKLEDCIPIITGFICSNENGNTTNLGRGGSDYTASIFASALDARLVEIWSDVNGFMTADPRFIKNAESLNSLSYEEAIELCDYGAKVIYSPTLIPAVEKQLPIVLKNTFQTSFKGTLITTISENGKTISGVTSLPDVKLIRIQGKDWKIKHTVPRRVDEALSDAGIKILRFIEPENRNVIEVVINESDAAMAREILDIEFETEFLEDRVNKAVVLAGLGLVTVVGVEAPSKNVKSLTERKLAENGICCHGYSKGSVGISVLVNKEHLDLATNILHNELAVTKPKKEVFTEKAYPMVSLGLTMPKKYSKSLVNQI